MNNKRPCRYGSLCRNKGCPFSHSPQQSTYHSPSYYAPNYQSASSFGVPTGQIQCRYGMTCTRPDCKYLHPSSKQQSPHRPPSFHLPSSSSSPVSNGNHGNHGMIPCRFGSACTSQNCRFFHEGEEEFTPEEEEFMDEILDMIEQEQRTKGGNTDDEGNEEDDKNLAEIFAYMDKQPTPSVPSEQFDSVVLESEYSLPEEAEAEFEAMMLQQRQGMPPPHMFYQRGYPPQQVVQDNLLSERMSKLDVKGLSATSAPFVPRTYH